MKNHVINTQLLFLFIAASIFLMIFSSDINAMEYESRQHLESIVSSYIAQHVEHKDDERIIVNITALDSNTKLVHCDSEIQASLPNESHPAEINAIDLQCHSEPGWKIFVPVSVQFMSKVIAVNRLISSGEIITENDIGYEEHDKNRLYDGFFLEKKDVVGLSVVRSLSAGTVLTKKNLKQVAIIKQNQTVTLVLKKGSIEVVMIGIAKSDGYLNEPIKVLNPSSKKIIDAVVIGPDRVQLIC